MLTRRFSYKIVIWILCCTYWILCTLYRDDHVAANLMERLGPDLDMKMHLKAFQHKPGYTLNPDTLRICMHLMWTCPLLQKSLGDCKNRERTLIRYWISLATAILRRGKKSWFVLDVYDDTEENDAKDEEGHIMISYSWQQQSIIKGLQSSFERRDIQFG